MDWSKAEIWSRGLWVQLGDNHSPGYKLGTENKEDIKQKKREGVPSGSTRLGQLSSRVPRGNLPLVHVSKWAPPWHKSLTGGPHHSATWQAMTGPPHSACATWRHTTEPPQQALPHGSTYQQINLYAIKPICHISLFYWWHLIPIDCVEIINLNPVSLTGGP
jgi:hypothetical protein